VYSETEQFPSVNEMERLTQALVDTVFQAWHIVNVFVQSHEVTIRAKWTAMTHGSIWHFAPTGKDDNRPIQFHEPHPSGKLSLVQVRRYGRRLGRTYGWTGEMFVLG
jgi:hypothetical protein